MPRRFALLTRSRFISCSRFPPFPPILFFFLCRSMASLFAVDHCAAPLVSALRFVHACSTAVTADTHSKKDTRLLERTWTTGTSCSSSQGMQHTDIILQLAQPRLVCSSTLLFKEHPSSALCHISSSASTSPGLSYQAARYAHKSFSNSTAFTSAHISSDVSYTSCPALREYPHIIPARALPRHVRSPVLRVHLRLIHP